MEWDGDEEVDGDGRELLEVRPGVSTPGRKVGLCGTVRAKYRGGGRAKYFLLT
jgi:hypothetical protein